MMKKIQINFDRHDKNMCEKRYKYEVSDEFSHIFKKKSTCMLAGQWRF